MTAPPRSGTPVHRDYNMPELRVAGCIAASYYAEQQARTLKMLAAAKPDTSEIRRKAGLVISLFNMGFRTKHIARALDMKVTVASSIRSSNVQRWAPALLPSNALLIFMEMLADGDLT